MRIAITKQRAFDRVALVRADGSTAETTFPKKGPVPHDAVHYLVESEFGLRNGFWGMVAKGLHPDEIAGIAHAAGHASAKRAAVPEEHVVQLIQAERLVECFEADLWSGGTGDPDIVVATAQVACEASHVPLPAMSRAQIAAVREKLVSFAQQWSGAPQGHVAVFEWGGV